MSERPEVAQRATSAALVRVTHQEDGRLLHLVLDRPRGNVLTMDLLGELGEALRAHRDEAHLKLVAIQGAGGHFSFGASVEEHRPEPAPRMLAAFHGLLREVAAYPVPVAALVEGRCLGGGFELVLCCHLVFATRTATFGCPEVRLGVFPPVLAALGPARLGGAVSERLLLTGAELPAEEAQRLGLVAAIFPPEGDAAEALRGWFRERLAPLSAFSLRVATRAAREGSGLLGLLGAPLDAMERRYLRDLLPSHDGNEGVRAFLERREPAWQDR
ncbi:MAG: enoyl-CoA hydratase/isomerase family protein [Planctomycetes bacterium]|nr:enoyl-CoA hydratase/isomerase family protein [Planctomycetota bacterium]